jgi:hypothetical protein
MLLLFKRADENSDVTKLLKSVDLCFVVDTTGSMQPFIDAAQRQLIDTMSKLSANNSIDLRVGLVEYRDHPPQDKSFVTCIHQLTGDLKKMQKIINVLKADGGGDAPEAVYDGVFDACTKMEWQPYSCRFILLVGDAPPHGTHHQEQEFISGRARRRHNSFGDAWPDGCPCGLTTNTVTAAAENGRVTIQALSMQNAPVTVKSFAEIARSTGGHFALATTAGEVVSRIIAMLDAGFRDLQFDERMLEIVRKLGRIDVSALAEAISCPRLQAASSIARLGRRGFLQEFTAKS